MWIQNNNIYYMLNYSVFVYWAVEAGIRKVLMYSDIKQLFAMRNVSYLFCTTAIAH